MSQLKLLPAVLQLLLLCLSLQPSHAYNVPKATVKVNTPQGFEVSIPDERGLSLFAFHGKLNEPMDDLSDQTWATDIVSARQGRWTYRNRQQQLQPGDVLYYWTTARYNGIDYHNYNQRYVVGALKDTQSLNIDVNSSQGGKQPLHIHGNPTINIFAGNK
ncbi:CG13422 [Drosophila busckii]|uniref:CG13422 n=1 Tax=Drosophila busckii TaxID=30019 RepID=A0A0M4EW55_DROBS|nr:CG13422 [Drosophila busckii]